MKKYLIKLRNGTESTILARTIVDALLKHGNLGSVVSIAEAPTTARDQ